MSNTLLGMLDMLAQSNSCSNAGKLLHSIADGLAVEMNPDELSEFAYILLESAHAKKNAYCNNKRHKPYYIATGMEANLMYIAKELGDCSDEPKWTLAKLKYLALKLEEANDMPVPDCDRIQAILDYCFSKFPLLKTKASIIVIALPDINIELNAEYGYFDPSIPTTFINAKNTKDNLIELQSYESAALLIAAKSIPRAAFQLMESTTTPEIRSLTEQDIRTSYLLSIELGLALDGPYGHMIEHISKDKEHAKAWQAYLMRRKK